MRKFVFFISVLYLALQVGLSTSCKHDPLLDDLTPNPVDTTGDTTTVDPGDTTVMGDPCDPNLVYFDLQVLPILRSNCAFSGCHDATSAQDDVVLENYETVMATADVEAFDLNGSKIYEVLTETDPDKRMPQAPRPPLSQDQIQLIAKWILQGAKDLNCDPNAGACDTENVTYSQTVAPILQNTCVGCHSGAAPSGNVNLSNHAGVEVVANDGRLVGAISWATGFPKMPQGGNQLPDCTIEKIKAWVDAGAPNN